MQKANITRAAVIGSGIMGSRIACHLANAGIEVLLLDRPAEADQNVSKKDGSKAASSRNKPIQESLAAAIKANPSPLYLKDFRDRIRVGNIEDDLDQLGGVDWVIEAIIEDAAIKSGLFERIEKVRKPGTLISTNTSGIPINVLSKGRSEDFRKHFCGTHFFNPPRYLPLLEIVPGPDTLPQVLEFFMDFGRRNLGKETVLCKDTPAFIANRVGVFGLMKILHLVEEMDLSVEEVDKLTGPLIGRPKSATFRTADVVGLDTFVKVAKGLQVGVPKDEQIQVFALPNYLEKMVDQGMLGAKTGMGFYKKEGKGSDSVIYSLDLKTLKYKEQKKPKWASVDQAKGLDSLDERMKMLCMAKDQAGEFYRRLFASLFSYVAHRIPEIADDVDTLDRAMCAGFGWQKGPFALWDIVGMEQGLQWIKEFKYPVPQWLSNKSLVQHKSFYRVKEDQILAYRPDKEQFIALGAGMELAPLHVLKGSKKVWGNTGATLVDLGDGVLNLAFHTKMNTMGSEVIQAINHSISLAEKDFRAMCMVNDGDNFSAGANLALILMMAAEQDYDELNMAIRTFQQTVARARFSSIPVIIGPHGLTLGGGCEISLHADALVAHAETYTGLVELGAGLIPGGGGTKEFALRLSDELVPGGIELDQLRERFMTIAMAKVSTSAHEAFDLGIYIPGKDKVVMHRGLQLQEAKKTALAWSNGYQKPLKRHDIKVMGRTGLGLVNMGAESMLAGGYISEYDAFLAKKLGFVLCGGDLSQSTQVSEDYLLDLERETFLSLCGEKKTLERMQHLLQTGKPLRN